MILTDEDITEYQELVKKVRGIDISREDALEDATSLIEYVRLTQKPIPKEILEKYQVKDKDGKVLWKPIRYAK